MSAESPLVVRNLRKRFGRTEVLKGIDLTVPAGSVYGFVGLNGAGKTTTIECVLGLLRVTAGDVSILGRVPGRLHSSKGRIGVVFDRPCLYPSLSVRDELRHAAIFDTGSARRGLTPADVEKLLGLERYRSQKTRRLSWGNRRRLSIARALLGEPELIILDEPFSGLDPTGVDDLLRLMERLRHERRITFVLSSHQLKDVERICTHVGVLHEGNMIEESRTSDLLESQYPMLEIKVDDVTRARALLARREDIEIRDPRSPGQLDIRLHGAAAEDLNEELVRAGIRVSELKLRKPSLARWFRNRIEATR